MRSLVALAACWLLLLGGPVAALAADLAAARTPGDYGAVRVVALAGFAVGLLLLATTVARAASGADAG